jgi:hypothetical protein
MVVVMVFRKDNLYTADIRYNTLSREMFFFNIGYDGGGVIFAIDKNGYRLSVEDYELGSFRVVSYNIDYSKFSQQITDINEFGNSVDLTYIKAFSKVKVNGKEIEVDNNSMVDLICKLFYTTLSYVRANLSSYNFPLDISDIILYYTYEFRNPTLNGYWAYTRDYIYKVSNVVGTLVIYKKEGNCDEPKEIFQIYTDIRKYSRHILSNVVSLVLQSRIKANDYEIKISGEDVTINDIKVQSKANVVSNITCLIKSQIGYIVSTVKNKLNMLA